MASEFDLICVGSGNASKIFLIAAREGWRVALVEEAPLGGTCALRGCTPKKMLRTGAEALDWVRRMEGRGVVANGLRGDWAALQRHKGEYVDPIPEKNEAKWCQEGVHIIQGTARFVDRNAMEVNGERLTARRAIALVTGSRPRPLPFPGAEHVTQSDEFMELPSLPRRIVFVGGGIISCEFAHIALRFGSECTVVEMGEQILGGFDPDLVELLRRYSEDTLGLRVRTKTKVAAVEKAPDGSFRVIVEGTGKKETLEADLVVHGAGRVPNIEALELEKGGVEFDKRRGILVDETLRSVSNPLVYAAGDCAATGGPMLTPVASLQGAALVDNILRGKSRTLDYRDVAGAAYTLPPIAAVGLHEAEAREKGLDIHVEFQNMSRWFVARQLNEPLMASKVITEEKTGVVLGAHLVGHHADEMINLFAVAMRFKIPCSALKDMMFAYPSSTSQIKAMTGPCKESDPVGQET